VAFSGRLGSKALVAGNYVATLTASAGALQSTPVKLTFIIVR
jgi:hypothetical protein